MPKTAEATNKRKLPLWLILLIVFACFFLLYAIGYEDYMKREQTPGGESVDSGFWSQGGSAISLEGCSLPDEYKWEFEYAGNKIGVAPAFLIAIFDAGEHHQNIATYRPHKNWPKITGPWARPTTSSAKGPFQILDGTWRDWQAGLAKMKPPIIVRDRESFHDSALAAAYGLYNLGAKGFDLTDAQIYKATRGYRGINDTNYLSRVNQAYYYWKNCSQRSFAGSSDQPQRASKRKETMIATLRSSYYFNKVWPPLSCARFTSAGLMAAGYNISNASAQTLFNQSLGIGGREVSNPEPGDLFFFFSGRKENGRPTNRIDHVGVMLKRPQGEIGYIDVPGRRSKKSRGSENMAMERSGLPIPGNRGISRVIYVRLPD